MRVPQNHRYTRDGHQRERGEYALPARELCFFGSPWKDFKAGSRVVFAIHPGNRHEMRELPEKEDREKQPRASVELSGSCDVSDEHGHGTGYCAGERTQRRSTFERGIKKQIPADGQQGNHAGGRPHGYCQVKNACNDKNVPKTRAGMGSIRPAAIGPASCSSHLRVKAPLNQLVQCTRAARYQNCSEQRAKQ